MRIIEKCGCGKKLTEKNFVPPIRKAEWFGLPKGTLGNLEARFIKLKCTCGMEYIGEVKDGKQGGSKVLGRILDTNAQPSKPPKQAQPKPAGNARIVNGEVIFDK